MAGNEGPAPPLSAIADVMDGVNQRRNRLADLGLLEPTDSSLAGDMHWMQQDPGARALLMVYLQDALEKLETVAALDAALSGFVQQVNDRLPHAKLHIHPDRGFRIISETDADIPPGRLSSGEQHMLTLLAEQYLGTLPGDLILVDEPELSQHVAWQKVFLSRLIEQAKAVGFDAIVATHSPDIIQGHRGLMRPLMTAEDADDEC